MRIFAGFLGEVASICRQMAVGLSTTAIFSVFDDYFFGNFRNKASVIILYMQPLVGFSVMPKSGLSN